MRVSEMLKQLYVLGCTPNYEVMLLERDAKGVIVQTPLKLNGASEGLGGAGCALFSRALSPRALGGSCEMRSDDGKFLSRPQSAVEFEPEFHEEGGCG